ncbi:MAG: methyltransferase [Clostridiales bacterium]|jgi:tRNA1(Val) A37 N6-methylase TrmN6|nr:methyltransferase [Clostridiales bacterium]
MPEFSMNSGPRGNPGEALVEPDAPFARGGGAGGATAAHSGIIAGNPRDALAAPGAPSAPREACASHALVGPADGALVGPGEAIEDLQCGGLRIIQSKSEFRFGIDAVLLANFAKARSGAAVVELCAGSGVVSILMAAKTGAASFTGVEIQGALADMANRSAALNGLSGKVAFLRADLRCCRELFSKGSADAVVANPPYIKRASGIESRLPGVSAARCEICCTLGDVMDAAAYLLRDGGDLFMTHRPGRLADVCCSARARGVEPKRIQMVQSKPDRPPVLALIHAKKGARADLKFLPPLYLA